MSSNTAVRQIVSNAWKDYLKRDLEGIYNLGVTWNVQRVNQKPLSHVEIADWLYEDYGEDAPRENTIGLYRRIADHWDNKPDDFARDVRDKDLRTLDDVRENMGLKRNHPIGSQRVQGTRADGSAQIYSPFHSETQQTLRGLGATDLEIRMVGQDALREVSVDHFRALARSHGFNWGI